MDDEIIQQVLDQMHKWDHASKTHKSDQFWYCVKCKQSWPCATVKLLAGSYND